MESISIEQSVTSTEYFKQRVYPQLELLTKSALRNKRRYYAVKNVQIALSVSIPVLIYISLEGIWPISMFWPFIASIFVLVAEISLSMFQYYERWLKDNGRAIILQRQITMYETATGEYSTNTPTNFNDFVAKVERIIEG